MTAPAVWRTAGWSKLLGAVVLLLLSACASVDRNISLTQEAVLPIVAGEAAVVPAYDLAQAMLRAGLSREQVLKHGPELYTALATSGGAQYRVGKLVEAVFAIHSDRLYVTSRTRGTFVLPLSGSAPIAESQ